MYPLIEVQASKRGDPYLTLSGLAVESRYDPAAEGKKRGAKIGQKSGDCCLLLGGGLGYLPEGLKKTFAGKVIVYDPFGTYEKADCKTPQELEKTLIEEPFQKVLIETHPGYEPFLRFEKAFVSAALRKKFGFQLKEPVFSQRALEAIPHMFEHPPFSVLEGKCRGQRAYLASPGPSLFKAIPAMQKGDGIIFSAIQAAPLLQENGIEIDYLVCPDPGEMGSYIKACNATFRNVLSDVLVDRKVLDFGGEKTLLYHLFSDQITQILWEELGEKAIDEPFATVSEVMLHLADRMEFSEIVLCGMDFCWRENRYSVRAKGGHNPFHDPTETRFEIQLETSRATTETVYYHGARYVEEKIRKLAEEGKAVYQLSEGVVFSRALPFQKGEKKKNIVSIPPFTWKGKNRIEELLHQWAEKRRKKGKVEDRKGVPKAKQMPFLEPLESILGFFKL